MLAPTLHIQNARLSYQGTELFSQFNLSLLSGQWTCLLGPSGVGKTTLLKLLAGLTTVGSGDELEADVIVDQAPPIHLQVGNMPQHNIIDVAYMAQQDGLMPWLSVLDNVLLGAKLRREKADKQRACDLLTKVGLADVIYSHPQSLSGGMRQRVALIRTLMEQRSVVLMDEPFSSLDAITKLRLQELACELLEGCTVLLITHDPLEALRLSDAIYVMSHRPAILSKAIKPVGQKPRSLTDDRLLHLQGELLEQLEQAQFSATES